MPFKKQIYFRLFPTEKLHLDLIKIDTKCNKIYIRHLQELSKNSIAREATYWEFDTNGVFFNATQEKVYKEVTADLLARVIKGLCSVIMAFGQTGTGKSFTATGLHFSEEEFGIAPRIARELLELKRKQPRNIKMCIQMSYVELTNKFAVDLLKDLPNSIDMYKCREATKVKIATEYDALKYLFIGEGRKNYVENNAPYLSNIYTTAITFHITSKNMDLTDPTKICSRLHVIDMAGNDCCSKTSGLHKTPKEIGSANKTKSQLEQFILQLTANIPEHIKVQQRMNVLIYYLDGDFSCDNILRFIGHIKARAEDMLITLSMLRFGHIVQGLKTKSKQIKSFMNEEIELEYLRKTLESYDKEKHLNSVLLNTDLVTGLNQPRIAHLNNLIQNYLKNDIGEITVMNVADTKLVLKNMKEICNNYQNEVKKLQTENQVLMAQHQSETSLKHRSSKSISQILGSKVFRKSSKVRSKESLSKDKNRISEISVSGKVQAEDNVASVDLSYSKRKKGRSTSAAGVKSTGKKKSSNTSVKKQDSKVSVKSTPDLGLPIPNIMPQNQEIWENFASHGTYKERVEEYKLNERDIRYSFAAYVKELHVLQACKDTVHKCSNDLIAAQTFRRFGAKDEYDEDGFPLISFGERQCKDALEDAQAKQLAQQERLLKCQEELKIFLENRQNIIKNIDKDFDDFSREHYKLPSSTSQEIQHDLQEITFVVNVEHPEESLEEIEDVVSIPEVPEKAQMIKKFRKLMKQEIEKRQNLINEKRRKWKNI